MIPSKTGNTKILIRERDVLNAHIYLKHSVHTLVAYSPPLLPSDALFLLAHLAHSSKGTHFPRQMHSPHFRWRQFVPPLAYNFVGEISRKVGRKRMRHLFNHRPQRLLSYHIIVSRQAVLTTYDFNATVLTFATSNSLSRTFAFLFESIPQLFGLKLLLARPLQPS